MKIYAHYDSSGNIHSLITSSGEKGLNAMLSPEPGLSVAEIEGLKLDDDRDVDAIRKIAETHTITAGRPVKLSKKS